MGKMAGFFYFFVSFGQFGKLFAIFASFFERNKLKQIT